MPLNRSKYPTWAVATEDRGEGIFLQLAESAVASWERRVVDSGLWAAHKAAHRRNFQNRFSETAKEVIRTNGSDRRGPAHPGPLAVPGNGDVRRVWRGQSDGADLRLVRDRAP